MSLSKRLWLIALIVGIIAVVIAFGLLVPGCSQEPAATYEMRPNGTPSSTEADPPPTDSSGNTLPTEPPLPDNPVDFAYWQEYNPDIYAWIEIPDTKVNYPVLCASDQSDAYYLNHSVERYSSAAGSIYSEKKNGRSLSDRNTIIYGHNQADHSMFGELYFFESQDFFDSHKEFYIYTPGHILTYTVFAAYEYDDRHLLNSFNYADDDVWADYLEQAQNPRSMKVMTRDVEIALTDRIVTLSTCTDFNPNARYLVQGVLTNDQPTK